MMLPAIPCEICAGEARDWADIKGFHHYRCAQCGHLFVHPKPSPVALDAFYQSGDYYRKAEGEHERLEAEARDRAILLAELADQRGLRHRLLDVGCASGIFLTEAGTLGWSVAGVERSEATAKHARERAGCDVFSGVFESMVVPGGPFDVVTAWEVLEHVPDVRSFFRALAASVRSGGLLAISTPLGNGFVARVLGTRFPMLTPPEHLSIFSRRSLDILARECGLECVHIRSFSNLRFSSLVSGICQLAFGRRPETCSTMQRAIGKIVAGAVAWAPALIDRLGGGSEIQVIFAKGGGTLRSAGYAR